MNREKNDKFLNSKLLFENHQITTEDKSLIVMMDWEREIMHEAAKTICFRGGDILNIGFGMGIIDSFIQQNSINSHTIIEAHNDIFKKIEDNGWTKKLNVNIIFSPWQDVIDKLPKFDGIYFDTFEDDSFFDFLHKVHLLLKQGGVFSYFCQPGQLKDDFNILKSHFNCEVKRIKLDNIPNQNYYSLKDKIYYHPICTLN